MRPVPASTGAGRSLSGPAECDRSEAGIVLWLCAGYHLARTDLSALLRSRRSLLAGPAASGRRRIAPSGPCGGDGRQSAVRDGPDRVPAEPLAATWWTERSDGPGVCVRRHVNAE